MQEDRILIRIAPGDGVIDSMEIQARQHLRASRVLEGKTWEEALMLIPMIYHVCAHAHSFAAHQAFACAQGKTPPSTLSHRLLVLLETCREHARRIFMDWPILYGQKPDSEMVLVIQRYLQRIEESVGALMSKPQSQMHEELQRDVQVLLDLLGPLHDEVAGTANISTVVTLVVRAMREQGMAELGRSDVPSLCIHEVDTAYLAEQLLQDTAGEFIAAPHLHGQVYETGPLARMREQPFIQTLSARYGNGVLTRFCAMVLELVRIPQAMLNLILEADTPRQYDHSVALSAGAGMGGVEAARGFLWHRVEMEHERIKRYQILAPTEWNFHPRGALFRGLHGLRFQAKTQLHKLASMITTALDPCVACAIEVV